MLWVHLQRSPCDLSILRATARFERLVCLDLDDRIDGQTFVRALFSDSSIAISKLLAIGIPVKGPSVHEPESGVRLTYTFLEVSLELKPMKGIHGR